MQILLTIFSVIYVLFLPGFVLSFVFFKKGKIDIIERIALSFALSIAIVPLVVFYGNLVGIKITQVSVILYVFMILVTAGIILLIQREKKS